MDVYINITKKYAAWQTKQVHYSESTASLYVRIMRNFLNTLENEGLSRLNDVSAEEVRAFIHYRKGYPPYAPASIKVRTAALHLFFSWALNQKLVRGNPVVLYKRSRITSKAIPLKNAAPKTRDLIFLNATEQQKVVRYPVPKAFLAIRNRAIVTCLLASGLLIDELINLSNQNLDLRQGRIIIKDTDKHARERTVYLHTALCHTDCRNWLKIHPLKTSETFPLFVTRTLKPLSTRTLYTIVSRYLQNVGIQKKMGANILRQTAIINAIKKGDTIETIQKNFGIQSYAHAKTYTSYGDFS